MIKKIREVKVQKKKFREFMRNSINISLEEKEMILMKMIKMKLIMKKQMSKLKRMKKTMKLLMIIPNKLKNKVYNKIIIFIKF